MTETRTTDLLPKYEQLDAHFSELQKQEALLKNAIKRASDSLKTAKENLKRVEKEHLSETESSNKIRESINNIQSQYDGLKNKLKEDKLRLNKAQQRLQEVNSGLFADASGDATASLSDLLSAAIRVESQLEIELNTLQMKMTHSEKIINELEAQIRGLHKDDSAAQQEINYRQLQTKIDQLEQNLAGLNYSPDKYSKLSEQLLQIKQDIRNNDAEKNNILYNNRWLKFEYNRPNQSFPDHMIHGVVASLFKVDNMEFSTALQTAAGGRLTNIIVENDEVAAQLIDGNCMRERKTLLPLNKMQAEPLSEQLLRTAEQIVMKNNVWSVESLIKYDERYRTAMNYVFGRCLIARDLGVAKTIAFDKRIRCKSVTLDGDVFDPEGTLVGGSNNNFRDMISVAQKLNQINANLANFCNNQKNIEQEMKTVGAMERQFKELSRERDELQVKLRQMEFKMMQNNYLQVDKKLSETKIEFNDLKKEFKEKKSLHEQAKKKTAEAETNLANSASVKEKAQKEAEKEVNDSKKQLEKSENDFNVIDAEYEKLTVELKSNEDDERQLSTTIQEIMGDIKLKDEKLKRENDELAVHRETMLASEREVKAQKKCLQNMDEDINKKRSDIKKLLDTQDRAESNLEEVNHSIEVHHVDSAAAEEKLTKMLRKNGWIAEESVNFGKPGSMFDFESNNLRSAEQKVEKLSDLKQKLSRKVDMRGMNMLGQMEVKYDEVTSKYNQVLQDKVKLQDVIDDLDKRKDEVLKRAHEQVDQDFDKIFSTLLPGSRARLTPPEGKTLAEGLEFKISFGNVWKESLTELSGGQRSLVALSLILALLRFKPAPLYILDEVDAALDISHTQNIGTIIKEQFSNSQFIIVSLKDGMFNNANVLYKTKFIDGVSTVSRHVNNTNQTRRPMTEKNDRR